MTSSKWQALGNVYLLVEQADLSPETARDEARGTDGIVQVLASGDEWVDVVIWNPDGSTAEMSGNGTRIAARWLSERTGAEQVRVRVGARTVVARMLLGGDVEQEFSSVQVGEPETVDGIDFVAVSVGNPHAVVRGDPGEIGRIGPRLETHARFPDRTNVQVVRVDAPGEVTARV